MIKSISDKTCFLGEYVSWLNLILHRISKQCSAYRHRSILLLLLPQLFSMENIKRNTLLLWHDAVALGGIRC